MSIFLIGPDDMARIREAAAKARLTPITLDMLKRAAQPGPVVSGARPDDLPEPQEVHLPLGWRLNISAEEQPFGPSLHLSLSSPTPNKTAPRPEAFAMIVQALGLAFPDDVVKDWVEEFSERGKPAGKAINLIVMERRQ